jgi:hypothetical protein
VAAVIDWTNLWQGIDGWHPSGSRSRLPAEAVEVRPSRQAALPPPSRRQGTDPWAAAQEALDRQLAEFVGLEKQLAQAARRDGLDEDGPMAPTLHGLRLCITSLREMTRIISQVPSHTMGQIIEAITASRSVTQAETERFRAEIEHTETDIVRRIAHSIAESADKALKRRVRVFDRNTAFVAALILVMTGVACLGYGYRWGNTNATAHIDQTEWQLRAAFRQGEQSADIWALLMESNDITVAIKACHGANLIYTGTSRSACQVPLWTELPHVAPPTSQ